MKRSREGTVRDILERARQRMIDDDWARSCKVEPPPFPRDVLAELIAEVERLRKLERAVKDELTNITDDYVYDRLAAVVGLT